MKSLYERVVVGAVVALFLVAAALLGVGISAIGRADAILSSVRALQADAAGARATTALGYEYTTLTFLADTTRDRTGEDAGKFTTITPTAADFLQITQGGWEIVTSYLEMETAFPNFGNDRYVTGLQTNVRPQRLVLVLRRHRQAATR